MDAFWIVVAGVFGLAIGSFLTVVVDRVPEHRSIVSPGSRCPGCGQQIRARDNIPVISYVLLRGRCRACGEPISIRYPILEALTALIFGATAAAHHAPYVVVMLCALDAVLIAVSAIDIERRIIPNAITYPATLAFAVAVVLGWIAGVGLSPVQGVIGLLGYGGVFLLIAVISRGMGMGDVKLAALIGLVLGSVGLRYVAAAAGVAVLLGGFGGLLALAIGRGRKSTIPFGPYLAAGALVAIVFAQPISDWYLRTFVPA